MRRGLGGPYWDWECLAGSPGLAAGWEGAEDQGQDAEWQARPPGPASRLRRESGEGPGRETDSDRVWQ